MAKTSMTIDEALPILRDKNKPAKIQPKQASKRTCKMLPASARYSCACELQ